MEKGRKKERDCYVLELFFFFLLGVLCTVLFFTYFIY
jgi:hypothetical protein